MARPRKSGLDYFPFDVDFFSDEKVVCIGGEFGIKGELTVIRLLCAVYRNGYFALWNDNLKYKLKREMDGVSAELLEQIVHALVRRGFFNKSLFDSDRVLTSEGIQRRYFEAAKFRQRSPDLPYLLGFPKKNYIKTTVSQSETPVSQSESTQIKRKEMKLNKKSSEEDKGRPPSSATPFNQENFLKEFFGENEEGEATLSRLEAARALAISLGYPTVAHMRQDAEAVLSSWILRRHIPKSWEDAASHLMATLRKKQAEKAPQPQEAPHTHPRTADRQKDRAQRQKEWEYLQANAEKPADVIRRYGYDPDKVSLSQVLNHEWRERNPPESPDLPYPS